MNVPNLLTLLRLGLIPFFVISMLERQPGQALLVFVIAGITDGLDGFVARFFDQVSVLGTCQSPSIARSRHSSGWRSLRTST